MTERKKTGKEIADRQREKFVQALDTLTLKLEGADIGSAISVLTAQAPALREALKKAKHVFGKNAWLSIKTLELTARLAQAALERKGLAVHFPELRDWLYDNGYDESGERRPSAPHFIIDKDYYVSK